ncbi:MAG: response regulator [Gemmataceae bacterium]|nr:response regulator [Gemmataceae bacterium]
MQEALSRHSGGVLIVDDYPDTTAPLAYLARAWGHEAWTAPDARTALDLAARHRPAVVLLDLGLPDMNGFDLARRLRQLPGMESAWVAALTGYGTPADQTRSAEAGCQAHLVKPVDPDEIRRLLDDHDRTGPRPLTPEALASLDGLVSAAEVVEAIDGTRSLPGWDVAGWCYEFVPWGVRFYRETPGGDAVTMTAFDPFLIVPARQ